MMTFAVIFTSLLIALSGYIVNEKNADVLLAGYNTMSEDEKNRFDLINYLKFFRKFILNGDRQLSLISSISFVFSDIKCLILFLPFC